MLATLPPPATHPALAANAAALVARIGRARPHVYAFTNRLGTPWLSADCHLGADLHAVSFSHDGTLTPAALRAAIATAQAALP